MTAASQETAIEFRRAQSDDFESMVALHIDLELVLGKLVNP